MQRGKQQKQLKKSKGQRTEMGCEGKQKRENLEYLLGEELRELIVDWGKNRESRVFEFGQEVEESKAWEGRMDVLGT